MSKKKNTSLIYSPESIREVKKKLKAFNKKRLLVILISTIAVFALYETALSLEEAHSCEFSIATAVMFIGVTVLAAAVILLNHGFSRTDFTPDMLRKDISEKEADELCKKLNHQRELSKKLMMVLIPFMFALLLDVINLFYGDMLSSIFKFLVPN